MVATATARWEGSIDDGSGTMSTATGLEAQFSKSSRFADGAGSNPEELIGAAHAGCFSQFLSSLLSKNGTPPTSIDTTARVSLVVGDDGPSITRIDLAATVDVDGVSDDELDALAADAKARCPVSKALAGVGDVRLEVTRA
jgi:lipoyl-dependent peroxiredoxin